MMDVCEKGRTTFIPNYDVGSKSENTESEAMWVRDVTPPPLIDSKLDEESLHRKFEYLGTTKYMPEYLGASTYTGDPPPRPPPLRAAAQTAEKALVFQNRLTIKAGTLPTMHVPAVRVRDIASRGTLSTLPPSRRHLPGEGNHVTEYCEVLGPGCCSRCLLRVREGKVRAELSRIRPWRNLTM